MDGQKHKKTMKLSVEARFLGGYIYSTFSSFLFYLYVDGLGDATPAFSSSTSNGPPGESCAHAETWARNLLGLNLQWGRRDVEAAALDDQSVVQFLGLQGLACASGGEIDFLGGAGTDTGYLNLRELKDVRFARAFEDATAAITFRFLKVETHDIVRRWAREVAPGFS